MVKILALALTLCCASVITVRAADKPSDEQKAERKALVEKYDKNKDGKLDKDEVGAMSAEDKEKWGKLRGGAKKKKE
jgi:hypothetical protein